MANTYLSRTLSGSSSREQWTFSAWVKISGNPTGTYGYLFSCTDAANHTARISIMNNNVPKFGFVDSLISTEVQTNRLLRDNNGWYHLMVVLDTTLSTASDRVKLYVNGVRETSLANTSYPSQNAGGLINYVGGSYRHNIGSYNNGSSNFFNGIMSHVHFADGVMLAPTVFGETDSTTGEWKIKADPTFTRGTNGFSILMNGNTITDQSSGSNDWSLGGGTLTKTEDNPSNVFATLNPLVPDAGSTSYHHGNTQHNVDTANWRSAYSTLGMTTGKYYFEALKSNGSHGMIGVRGVEQCDGSLAGNNDFIGLVSQGWSLYNADGVVKNNNSDVGSSIGTYANGDYIGCFLDCDNSKLYFSKNGTMMNTTGYSITAGLTYMFGVSGHSTYRWVCNFGNGAFGSTQLTGTTYNGSDGNGIFKYNPNSITLDGSSKSFKSISTKGLNT